MIIGYCKKSLTLNGYDAEIASLAFTVPYMSILAVTDKKSDREPDFRIFGETQFGLVQFGAAWNRVSEKGKPFLSLQLDSPGLEKPFHAAVFFNEGRNVGQIVWSRPKDSDEPEAVD